MSALSKNVLYYGKEEDLPEQIKLQAGPLSMILEEGALRHMRIGDHEIIRSVYVAVRAEDWATIPPAVCVSRIEVRQRTFDVTLNVSHKTEKIDFFWESHIVGDENGTVQFTMNGRARSTFAKNRIGFCVLYPIKEYRGKPCRVEKVSGEVVERVFPDHISPHQPFVDVQAIQCQVLRGLDVEVRFSGDVFEMEDQRNWTDASYKVYSTPLTLPHPVIIEKGTRVKQSVTLILKGRVPFLKTKSSPLAFVLTKQDNHQPLPAIGLSRASHGGWLTRMECERIKAVGLSHLRLDIAPSREEYLNVIAEAHEESTRLGLPLELVIHFSHDVRAQVEKLEQFLSEIRPKVRSITVFNPNEVVTSFETMGMVRKTLRRIYPEVPVGGGTTTSFTELNRNRPSSDRFDFVAYPMNPQVHAFDNLSLVENLAAQGETIVSARRFLGNIPIHISPVTLKIRSESNMASGIPKKEAQKFPLHVDEREMSLFGAVWTVGSLKYLAENGARSITYFETTGMLGIMETEEGKWIRRTFRSFPGSVFPMYHVFADVGEFRLGNVIPSLSSDPLRIDGIALRLHKRTRIVLGNMTRSTQEVDLHNLEGYLELRYLDETNCELAMKHPNAYRGKEVERKPVGKRRVRVRLLPYSILRVDTVPAEKESRRRERAPKKLE